MEIVTASTSTTVLCPPLSSSSCPSQVVPVAAAKASCAPVPISLSGMERKFRKKVPPLNCERVSHLWCWEAPVQLVRFKFAASEKRLGDWFWFAVVPVNIFVIGFKMLLRS
ncbi:hypothetical protein KY285_019183 [Solanum tuberosum]|nr:hypothetical protein KY285_019183 [Solanum tuberosum]